MTNCIVSVFLRNMGHTTSQIRQANSLHQFSCAMLVMCKFHKTSAAREPPAIGFTVFVKTVRFTAQNS
jgi:hypothetical protein